MIESVKLCDGEYEFTWDDREAVLRCGRHGKPWREFVGDNAVLAMFQRVRELESRVEAQAGDVMALFQRIKELEDIHGGHK